MKPILKSIVVSILGRQTKRLRKKQLFQVIAVAGSVGKTSTKLAIAEVLATNFRVRWQTGNYNDIVTVPLVFFGLPLPSLLNPFAWLMTFLRIELQLLREYPFDVVVVELGTDGPGQLRLFEKYLFADIGVLTAITPEHMEFFGDMKSVADEEMTISSLSKHLFINVDLCSPEHIQSQPGASGYGMNAGAVYKLTEPTLSKEGYHFTIKKHEATLLETTHSSVSVPQLYSLTAAAAAADRLGMNGEEIKQGIQNVRPVSGRMQILQGIRGITIVDDTYNSSPEAVKSALETLYSFEAPQKVALLGNMNELGGYSAAAHAEVGALCDPEQIDLVITLGTDANEYLAAAAEKRGCQVKRFDSPYEAAEYLKTVLKDNAVLLAKGSQNKVYAEEAIKQLLRDPADASKLVRQSKGWLKKKQRQFKRVGA